MEGVTVIRVIRQIRIFRFINSNEQNDTARLMVRPEEPALQPPPETNNRCGTITCLNAFVFLIICTVGIGSIVLGAINIHNCPAEKMLPTGLIIFGVMLMVARLLNCSYDCERTCDEESCKGVSSCILYLNVILYIAVFGMFIALCVYAFRVNPTTKPEDHLLPNYCDYTLYKTCLYGCIVGLIPFICLCCCGNR